MVIKMADVIKFKEPERCDYLYIDENNRLFPISGGANQEHKTLTLNL